MSKFNLGDRVKFVYHGEPPFKGQTIHGEVALIDEKTGDIGVYRDEQWRHADAVVTWVAPGDLEKVT